MHADEFPIDAALVQKLLGSQFPELGQVEVSPLLSSGSSNALYRVGPDLLARLPRTLAKAVEVRKEHAWLPKFAPVLPLAVPEALALGAPGEGYPWHWSLYRFIPGKAASEAAPTNLAEAARQLAGFIAALQQIDTTNGPPPGSHNSFRGAPLAQRDAAVRAAIQELGNSIDTSAALDAWESALRADPQSARASWIHGDLIPDNLLTRDGELSAVIDFGLCGVGDPACDLMVAWTLLPADARQGFRSALKTDSATWKRASGWALSFGLIALPYYQRTNPGLARTARHAVDQVLAELASGEQ